MLSPFSNAMSAVAISCTSTTGANAKIAVLLGADVCRADGSPGFASAVTAGIAAGAQPVIRWNHGARRHERVAGTLVRTRVAGGVFGASLALVTERSGGLHLVNLEHGSISAVTGEVPEVVAAGQGGLLDVAVHPDYSGSGDWIYLTYSAAGHSGGETATHLGRGRLHESGPTIEDFEVLYIAEPFHAESAHFGSRIVFDGEGYLYMTTGDRRDRYTAQDLGSNWGKILCFHDDGRIPVHG